MSRLNVQNANGSTAVRRIVSVATGVSMGACMLILLYFTYRQPAALFGGKLHFYELLVAAVKAWVWVIALFVISVVIHESGHAFAAWRFGMTIYSVRFWPIDWQRRRRGVRPRWAASAKPPAAVFALPNPDQPIQSQYAWFAAGGPTANATTAVCAATIAWIFRNPAHADLSPFMVVFAIINTTIAIANLLPIGREVPSDGTQLRNALSGKTAREADIDLLQFARARLSQTQRVDVSEPIVERWMNSPRPVVRACAFYIHMQRELEHGDITAIAASYTRLVEMAKALGPQSYAECGNFLALSTFEFIYELCMHGGSVDNAKNRLAALGRLRRLAPRSLVLRARAAIAFRCGNHAEAQRLMKHARNEADGEFETTLRAREIAKLDAFARYINTTSIRTT